LIILLVFWRSIYTRNIEIANSTVS